MSRRIVPFILAGALSIAAVAPAAAASHQTQLGGAGGLVAAVIQAQVRDVDVFVLNNALNNLLRNADVDINVLNILNDSQVLSHNNIEIGDINVLENGTIIVTLLSGMVLTFVPA